MEVRMSIVGTELGGYESEVKEVDEDIAVLYTASGISDAAHEARGRSTFMRSYTAVRGGQTDKCQHDAG